MHKNVLPKKLSETQSSKQTEIVLCVRCILLSLVNWIVEKLRKGKAQRRADRHWSCSSGHKRSVWWFIGPADGRPLACCHMQLCVFWCGSQSRYTGVILKATLQGGNNKHSPYTILQWHIKGSTLYSTYIEDPFRNKLQSFVSPVCCFILRKNVFQCSDHLLVMALSSPVGCARLKLRPTLGNSWLGLVMLIVGWVDPLVGRGPHLL